MKSIFLDRSMTLSNGCIEWTGSIQSSGYGHVTIKQKQWLTHRLSWTLSKGKIPYKKLILHRCDNRKCINIDHLFVGTHKQNSVDMWNKGRGFRTTGRRQNAKLTESQVREIREKLKSYKKGDGVKLAKEFNVTDVLILLIKKRKIWKNLR